MDPGHQIDVNSVRDLGKWYGNCLVGLHGSQLELRKKEQLLERQSEHLCASQRVIEEQEEVLAEAAKELEVTELENSRLRQSVEKMQEESDCTR